MQSESLERLKKVFVAGIWATLASISVGFGFKIWLAQWVAKSDLALYHSVVDVISLSLILMTGFRSSMIVSYSQTNNDRDIINIFRFSLLAVVLLTWGIIIPYIKHTLNIDVSYLQLVGVIVGMGFKVYFTNLIAMYRLYDTSNKVTWLDPISNVLMFLLCHYLLKIDALSSLLYGLTLSSLFTAAYMFIQRKKAVSTRPIASVQFDPALISYVKKSFTASLEAGASILMIYITVLLTISYFSVDELGDFQVVVRPVFTYMTMLFVFPIYKFVLPELAVNIRQGNHQQVKKIRRWVYKLSLIVGCCFFAIIFLWGKALISWVFPSEYSGALPVLLHFSMFFVFMMLNAYQLAFIKAHGRFNLSLIIRCMGIVTLVVTYYVLSQMTENVVAIITALCSGYVVMFILSSFAEYRIINGKAEQPATP